MKFIKYLLIIFAAITAILLLLGLVAPRNYEISRSVNIKAPASEVLPHLSSLKKRHEWSPWTELDPGMKVTYEGTDGQPGSKQFWEGNDQAGKGMQEILSVSESKVETKIKFIEPFESEMLSSLALAPESTGTKVTWTAKGENPFPFNVFCLFMDMDSMIGKDFEKGLGKLKVKIEKE
jgi:hypothetical protein